MHPHYFDDEKMNGKKEDYGHGFNDNTHDIINFAMKKLHYGECKRDNVDIKNFQSQVQYTCIQALGLYKERLKSCDVNHTSPPHQILIKTFLFH